MYDLLVFRFTSGLVFASNTVISEAGNPRSFFDFGKSIVWGSVFRMTGVLGDLGGLGDTLLTAGSSYVKKAWLSLSEYSTLSEAFLLGRGFGKLGVEGPEREVDLVIDRYPSYSVLLDVEGDSSMGDDSYGVRGVPYDGESVSAGGNEVNSGPGSSQGPEKAVVLKFVYSGYGGE